MNLPLVQFEIKGLLINSNETLLVIIGDRKVVVCDLPFPGFMGSEEPELKVKCRNIGSTFFQQDITLKKVIWNPIHRYDASLVLLTSDNVIRSFDLFKSSDIPDQEISLNVLASTGNSFDVTIDEFEAVSIAFGTSSDPHGLFTLYVLSREGDIYALCPFVPENFLLTQRELEELFDSAVVAENEYRTSEDSQMNFRKHYKRQLDWASEIWKQASSSVAETRQNIHNGSFQEYYVLERPRNAPFLKSTPSLQGPFSVTPYPDEFYYTQGTDIATLDNSVGTVICTAYTNGTILTAVQFQSVDMCWSSNEQYSDLSLISIEYAPLSFLIEFNQKMRSNADLSPKLFVAPYTSNAFYLICFGFAYRIDISPWSSLLQEAIEEESFESLSSILQSSNKSKISLLMDPRNEFIQGIVDFFFDHKYTLTASPTSVFLDTWKENTYSSSLAYTLQKMKLNADNNSGSDNPEEFSKAITHLDASFDTQKLFSGMSDPFPIAPQSISVKSKISFDLDTLLYFNEVGEHLSKQLTALHQSGLTMRNRLIDQRCELHRQVLNLQQLRTKTSELKEETQNTRAADILERQNNLQQRAAKLVSILANSGSKLSLQKSNQEKKWVDELERLKSQMSTPQGVEARVKAVSFLFLFFFLFINCILLTFDFFRPPHKLIYSKRIEPFKT